MQTKALISFAVPAKLICAFVFSWHSSFASTGLKTALVEKFDFSSGTSSRSTKLIHGGVRYLQKAVFNLDIEQVSWKLKISVKFSLCKVFYSAAGQLSDRFQFCTVQKLIL